MSDEKNRGLSAQDRDRVVKKIIKNANITRQELGGITGINPYGTFRNESPLLQVWDEISPSWKGPKRFLKKTLEIHKKVWFNRYIKLADIPSVTARLRVCLPTW